MNKIIKLPEVTALTGRSRSSIYADVKKDKFPAPISLGQRAVGWLEAEVSEWIENKIAESRGLLSESTPRLRAEGRTLKIRESVND